MRITPLLLLSLFSVWNGSIAQNTITPVWQKIKSSPLSGGWTEGWGVDIDKKGDIYWPVSFDSTASNHLYNICIYKFDSTGRQRWQSYYAGAGLHNAFVCNASDTSLYVGGIENTVSPYAKSAAHMLFLKIDTSNGTILKHNNLNFGAPAGYDEVDDIIPASDGLYCGGWAQVNGGFGVGVMGLLKIDRNLNLIKKTILGDTTFSGESHIDGHIIIDSTSVYACGMWEGHGFPANLTNGKKIVSKFSRAGLTLADSVTFGTHFSGCLEDALGSATDGKFIYLTGYSNPVTTSDLQLFVAKFDKNLHQLWIKYFGGTGGEEARAIKVDKGFVYIGGASSTPAYAPFGGYDAIVVVYDTAGNFIRCNAYGDSKDNEIRDLVIKGRYMYISGTSGTRLFNGGSSDSAFLVKIDINTLITGADPLPGPFPAVQVYPNPVRNFLSIRLTELKEEKMHLIVYNITGGKLMEKEVRFSYSGADLILDVSTIPPGIYFLKCELNTGPLIVKFVKTGF
ncbi:MAG: T9SS type A sorting domain-containing protein [Bacteroidia bacterium]